MTTPSPLNPLFTPPQPFVFPTSYSFPPFFTPQPTLQTHHIQLQKWSTLITQYCAHYRVFRLSVSTALESDLFFNKKINKRIGREDVKEVLEFMRESGRVEWVGKGGEKEECWVWWKGVEEWAGLVERWVEDTAQKGTVLTVYELLESEATIGQEFHGMDPELLQRALQVLVKRGKAQIFGDADSLGVKFF